MYKEVEGIPEITYHSKCRKIFNMERDLQVIKSSKSTDDTELCSNKSSSMRLSSPGPSTPSEILPPVCIFCGKQDKYKQRKRETLITCSTFEANKTLCELAESKNDTHMMVITAKDLIASKAKYHTSCYRQYTRVKMEQNIGDYGKDTNYYEIAENESFLELVDFWLNVVEFPTVIKFRDLVDLMKTAMKKRGEDLSILSKKNMRKKLERRFTDINFQSIDSMLYVYPSSLTQSRILTELVRVNKTKVLMKMKALCYQQLKLFVMN